MSIGSTDYALLEQDSYIDRQARQEVTLGGVAYTVFDKADDPVTGYQATAYQRKDTGEIVIANRGTEFGREALQDGALTDGGMVLAGVNAQMPDAMSFTKKILENAKIDAEANKHPLNVTVTGHSLGGTLAEAMAYKYGLHGETFNSYGAAGLLGSTPAGGNQVINHVRATDAVSAASAHFGETRTYASQADLGTLNKADYHDGIGMLSARNPIKAIDFDAHGIDNFTPDNKRLGHSIINPENAAMYRTHQGEIDRYRNDIKDARTMVSANWEVPKAIGDGAVAAGEYAREKAIQGAHATEHAAVAVGHATAQAYDETRDKVVQGAHVAAHAADQAYDYARNKTVQGIHATERGAQYVGHKAHQAYDYAQDKTVQGAHVAAHAAAEAAQGISHAAHAAGSAISKEASREYDTLTHPGEWLKDKPAAAPAAPSPRLDHQDHPDHAMYLLIRNGVHQIDAQQGRAPDQRSDNLAGALTIAAKTGGLKRVDEVVLSDDATRAYVAHHAIPRALTNTAHVEVAQAINTPLEKSSEAAHQLNQQQSAQTQAQIQQNQQTQQSNGPTMTR
jgi:hypothetical protein